MKIRISYICVFLACFFCVRFWLLADESQTKLEELYGNREPNAEIQDLLAYSKQTSEMTKKITRITISFLVLATVMFIIEERKKRQRSLS